MFVDAADLDAAGTYRLLVGSVVPRPIAWVTTGRPPKPTNLAPFSSFAWVSQYPAMLGMTVNRRPTGDPKDTLRNIHEDGEYVVNVARAEMLADVHASSEWLPPETSEATYVGAATTASALVNVPRLQAAPVSMECVHERTIRFSRDGGEFVVGRVVAWHIAEGVMRDGRIDTELLQPLARLAGPRYARLGAITELQPVRGG
jgi:flavin reductase (DIM6/NTAB) family NADH-FMN oxidoreductase RutF